ncbi:MAG: ATP-binding cassette domain-containing protein [Pseudarcicella sp.]|nr:ATP-binding cassette domain-containing protein [Pseudarcicella sp.]MBP6410890.1 ATP-binding cassette domain-containing protein [Pseudarcicella sp.]
MAKRAAAAFQEVSEKDKKKITKEGIHKALEIFKFILPYKWTYILGFIFLILSQITTMSIPFLLGKMVRSLVPSQMQTSAESIGNNSLSNNIAFPELSFNQITGFIILILVLQSIFSFFRVYTFSRVSEQSVRDLRQTMYSKILSLPITFFEQNRVGDLMSRMTTDISQLQGILATTVAELFRQVFTLLGGILFIVTISGKLTLFMLSTFPFLVILALFFGKYTRKNARKIQDELATSNTIVEETLQSIQVVKAFTNENLETKRYNSSVQKVVDLSYKVTILRGGFISFVIFILFGSIVGMVWYGGNMVLNNEITFDKLFTFIIYTAFIGGSVGGLGDIYAQIQRTIGSSERILDILNQKSEIDTQEKQNVSPQKVSKEGSIEIQNINFAYPSRPEMQILKNVSMDISTGKKVALVGHSGAGKSTIAQLLMRFYDYDSGSITLNGKKIQDYDLLALRKLFAIVPQEVMLFGGTIYENISYGNPDASHEEVVSAAKKANALEFIDTFPEKFETIVGERGIKLSGGQRQRIAIARAILKDPAILILDEATSALDSASEKLVQDALETLMENRTSIIIAHRLSTIRNVDNIYVLKDGKVAEQGNHVELLLNEDGIYANLVKLQHETSLRSNEVQL